MMRRSPLSEWPVAASFVIGLLVLLVGVVLLFELGVLTYAYHRLGIDRRWAYGLLVGSIVGSRVNIPVARWSERTQMTRQVVTFFGVRYLVPTTTRTGETVLAVNVGGAIIPTGVAGYLIVQNHLGWRAVAAALAVTAVVYLVARPVPGIGIAVPTLIPPLAAALVAGAVGGPSIPATAYVAGTLGSLVGADLLNLRRIRGLGAPLASIGGAGTFDGIFLTGVLAVVLAAG
jgi:uncharacterized membrane protein